MSTSKLIQCVVVIILFSINNSHATLYEGDSCSLDDISGDIGVCTHLRECEYGLKMIRNGKKQPKICGFVGRDPIVCCLISKPETLFYQCEIKDKCMFIKTTTAPPTTTTPRTYTEQEVSTQVVYDEVLGRNMIIIKPVEAVQVHVEKSVVGGYETLAEEFPHMAAIGFGDQNDIHWQCGGSLISSNHILTAAHCIRHKSQALGSARWIRLGDLDLKSDRDDANSQTFSIAESIPHPNYSSPSHYNDIAIMRLNGTIRETAFVKPGCLFTDRSGEFEPFFTYLATGWGRTTFAGDPSNTLLKVKLRHVDYEQCQEAFKNIENERLPMGIQREKQLCVGAKGKDTCQGDSGGPLQIQMEGIKIVGVTSFGKTCGIGNSPGVYVKIAEYIDWIESVICQ